MTYFLEILRTDCVTFIFDASNLVRYCLIVESYIVEVTLLNLHMYELLISDVFGSNVQYSVKEKDAAYA